MTKEYRDIFVTVMMISVGVYLALGLLSGGRVFPEIFYWNTTDAFMDFFNSVRDSSQGLGAYLDRKVIYPPMANLIFYLISLLTPTEYNQTEFEDRYIWSQYGTNLVAIWVFVAVCVVLFGAILYGSLRMERKKRLLVILSAACSVPFLNLLERGNILVISFLGTVIYMGCYRSEKAWIREIGLLALAFSFSVKLYPALFAWLLIGDRRYREFIRLVLYCVALLILPSFFFGGPVCLLAMLSNIFSFSSGASGGALAAISRYGHIPQPVVNAVMYAWFAICALIFVVAPFIYRERWKIWLSGCLMFLSYPPLTTIYAWVFFLIPLILMFNDGMSGRKHLPYFLPVLIPFVIYSIPIPTPVTINIFIVYPALIGLTVVMARDTVRTLRSLKKEKAEV